MAKGRVCSGRCLGEVRGVARRRRYARAEEITRLVMGGGQRTEVLVQLPKPGAYRVVSRGLTKTQFFCTGPSDAVPAGATSLRQIHREE